MSISSGAISETSISAAPSSGETIPVASLLDALLLGEISDAELILTLRAMFAFDATPTAELTALLRVSMALDVQGAALFEGSRTVTEVLALTDQPEAVYRLLLESALELGDTDTVSFTAVAQMVDALLLSGVASSVREAYAIVTEAIAFGALIEGTLFATLVSGLEFNDAIAAAYVAAAQLMDSLLLEAAQTPHVTLAAAIAEELWLSVSQTTSLEALGLLRDQLDFVMHVSVDNEQYIAWTMNTASKGATKYTNYPFNSFFKLGGKHYGVTDTGLYLLEGDDDAGTAIGSVLRLGMSSLGTRRLKRMASMYLGYAATGDMLLKVVTANETSGVREAHVYKLHASAADSLREGRVPIGKGLKSVYWDFQIENVDGADFELDTIEFLPLVLDRRLRGNAGGA